MNSSITLHMPAVPASSYSIWIENGLLQNPKHWIYEYLTMEYFVIITDDNLKFLYGEKLQENLKAMGLNVLLISFPAGESSKTHLTVHSIEEQMFRHGCNRHTLILALGGGVVGDVAGFVAATYMRGIPYIQIPTSLLAMVDSSVGGKTGIDTSYGKNLIGAYWQPKAVITDMNCLNTLPQIHLINGFFEVIKVFLTHDAKNFDDACTHIHLLFQKDPSFLKHLITRAVQIKAQIVEEDEKEQNQRALLNLGHTIGHALEKISDYKLLHGFAVGMGLLVEAKMAQKLNLLSAEHFNKIQSILTQLGIHGNELNQFDISQIMQAVQHDKKSRSGKARYVLLQAPGKVHVKNQDFTHPVTDETVKEAFIEVCYHDVQT